MLRQLVGDTCGIVLSFLLCAEWRYDISYRVAEDDCDDDSNSIMKSTSAMLSTLTSARWTLPIVSRTFARAVLSPWLAKKESAEPIVTQQRIGVPRRN